MSEVAILHLLTPEKLPHSYDEVNEGRSACVSEALRLGLSSPSTCDDAERLARIRLALRTLPTPRPAPVSRPVPKLTADSEAHDEYCRIARVSNDLPLEVFVRSILSSYEALMADVMAGKTSLVTQEWRELRVAFNSILRLLNGELSFETLATDKQMTANLADCGQQCNPLNRWIRGHHVFLVLIQSQITSLNCFINAYRARQWCRSALALDLTTVLLDGCGAALRFAGDFPAADYERDVRPTMMPPQSLPGMSGILARDHEYLVHVLKSLKEVFRSLKPPFQGRYKKFVSAFERTYEAHKLVCSRFVGDERPSLLARSEQASAAVDVLDKLKMTRIKSFQH